MEYSESRGRPASWGRRVASLGATIRLGGSLLVASGMLTAQTEWLVRVHDVVTGLGIPGVAVDGRTSSVQGVTDANGEVVLTVAGDQDAGETITVHGHDGYNYSVGQFVTDRPRTLWLVPKTAYHKTGLIPVAGTTAPIVFQGVTPSVQGPNPYTIEIEVPSGVLPEPAELWIFPVPPHASPRPMDADAYTASAIGLFAVELRNASGVPITKVLPSPGITVRASPTWYQYSIVAPQSANLPGVQCRLTATSGQWDKQPAPLYWDHASGMVVGHLRACSWWLALLPLAVLAGDTGPWQPPPAAPEPAITKADCVTTHNVSATPVVCGKIVGGSITVTVSQGGKVNVGTQFVAGIQVQLGLSPSKLVNLLARLSGNLGFNAQLTASGGIEIAIDGANQSTWPQDALVGANALCHSGDARMGIYSETYTLKSGETEIVWPIPRGILRVACLAKDVSCGEHCWQAADTRIFVYPQSLRVCDGDALKCQ